MEERIEMDQRVPYTLTVTVGIWNWDLSAAQDEAQALVKKLVGIGSHHTFIASELRNGRI